MILLSTAYFPNIQFFSKIENYEDIVIEKHENYVKKTYRNRCEILGANGKLSLTVPITKEIGTKINIDKVKIDYSEDWQKNHLKAIESAYGLSPFYEFYIDEIKEIFSNNFDYLFELNNHIINTVTEIVGINSKITFSKTFTDIIEGNGNDFRFSIHPKTKMQKTDPNFITLKYTQTFADRFDFISNLSILDVIFNLGPESLEYLHKTKIK